MEKFLSKNNTDGLLLTLKKTYHAEIFSKELFMRY